MKSITETIKKGISGLFSSSPINWSYVKIKNGDEQQEFFADMPFGSRSVSERGGRIIFRSFSSGIKDKVIEVPKGKKFKDKHNNQYTKINGRIVPIYEFEFE